MNDHDWHLTRADRQGLEYVVSCSCGWSELVAAFRDDLSGDSVGWEMQAKAKAERVGHEHASRAMTSAQRIRDSRILICEWCHDGFERPHGHGPVPKFCKSAHRKRAHEVRHRLIGMAGAQQVIDAARGYVVARYRLADATGSDVTRYQLDADGYYHALALALGEPCPCCDEGTCPG